MNTLMRGIFIVFFMSSCAHMKNGFYVKKTGDTSYENLAKNYGISEDRLRISNGDKSFSELNWVFIPRRVGLLGYWQLSQGEKGESIVDSSPAPVVKKGNKRRAKVEGKKARSVVSSRKLNFSWPVPGISRLSSRYGMRRGRMHRGIDIPAPIGTPIVASEAGKIIYSDSKISGYGKMTIIAHENDYLTVYAHASKNLFKEGDYVKKGDVIALVGQTGRTTGPHLHYEIRKKEKAVNPLKYLKIPSKKVRSVASRSTKERKRG